MRKKRGALSAESRLCEERGKKECFESLYFFLGTFVYSAATLLDANPYM